MDTRYDIIVIGGGHAGAEAAWAAARIGASVALVTMERAAIGRMSCNPAIGGLGKGHIVREIDALGGLMGLAIDRAGIQFRMLNRSKGPAVWAPRAQADRDLYAAALQDLLADNTAIEIVEGTVDDIQTSDAASDVGSDEQAADRRVCGVVLADGRRFACDVVIVTTGTFMSALMHCGTDRTEGGRVDEPAANSISDTLRRLGFLLGRLKTGTPPRVHRDTLDYDRLVKQLGENVPVPFSFVTDAIEREQVPCWITYTNEHTHALIRDNLHLAPMYSGQISTTGPRYCPSIEDKVVRFADKPRHQLFLEPEGYDNERIYCNGISTSLPREIQDAMLRTIAGLENARVLQYGYAVEYDFVPTHQTQMSLESKRIEGLFFAGQVNGTSGYEEAAGQGLVAGVNAARKLAGRDPLVLGRDEAYIGVMIDDLITKPPTEPYRMFTSRAEYRLALRSDNADQRLTPIGRRIGTVDDARWSRFERKRSEIERIERIVADTVCDGRRLADLIRRPETTAEWLTGVLRGAGNADLSPEAIQHVLTNARYAGYLARQQRQIDRFREMESMRIPAWADYAAMAGLRAEAREKLESITPTTMGQAGRIPGISPADLQVLWVHLAGRRTP